MKKRIRQGGKDMVHRIIRILMVWTLGILLVSCGSSGPASALSNGPKTLGEAMKISSEISSYEFDSHYFVYVFSYEGNPTRVYGKLNADLFEKLDQEMMNGADTAKLADVLRDVKIEKMENLNEKAPSQAELDAYKGKNGQSLLDAGFSADGYASNEDGSQKFFFTKDEFEYEVQFEETAEIPEDAYDSGYEAIVRPLTVKRIERTGLSSMAASIDRIEK